MEESTVIKETASITSTMRLLNERFRPFFFPELPSGSSLFAWLQEASVEFAAISNSFLWRPQ